MKLIYNSENLLDDAVQGFLASHKDLYRRLPSEYGYGIYKNRLSSDKVRVIVNGGGGYGPMWLGFLGDQLPDAAISGFMTSAPNAYIIYEMGKKIAGEKGVILLTNNFMGDYLNNDMASELLAHEKIPTEAIYVTDDIYSAPRSSLPERTGLTGIGQICKIAASAASSGRDLSSIYELCLNANARTRSLSAMLVDDKILFGRGIAGEPEKESFDKKTAEDTANLIIKRLLDDYGGNDYKQVYLSLSVNRSISYAEAYSWLFYLISALAGLDIHILGSACGTYFDNYSGRGAIISLLFCNDELSKYLCRVNRNGFEI